MRGNVLLAEDNFVNQELAKAVLARLGLQVDVANNGEEAVAMLSVKSYDVILMDCQMPVMDGYQATSIIRQRTTNSLRHLPIIALTANAMDGDRDKCLAAGMDDFLSKPYSPVQLEAVLLRWLPAGVSAPGREAVTPEPVVEATPGVNRPSTLNMQFLDQFRVLDPQGGLSLVKQVMRVYLDSSPALVRQCEMASIAGDAEGLSRAAHSLKSASANVGAEQLSELFRRIEALGREKQMEQATPLLSQALDAYAAAVADINALVAEA